MSMIGLYVVCDTSGKNARIEATTSLSAEKIGHDLSCGHRNGWTPEVAFPERFKTSGQDLAADMVADSSLAESDSQ